MIKVLLFKLFFTMIKHHCISLKNVCYSQVYLKENQAQLHLNGFLPRHRIFTPRQFHDKFSLSSCTHEQAQLIDSYCAKCLCSKPN